MLKIIGACLALTLICLWAGSPRAEDADPALRELVENVQARYQNITSMQAEFARYSRYVAAGSEAGRQVEGAGRLTWLKPLSLRLQQTQPQPELIVVHGNQVWWARENRKRADLYSQDSFTGGLNSILDALSGLSRLDEAFVVLNPEQSDKLAGMAQTLLLHPRQGRVDLQRLVLWFNDDYVLQGFRMTNLVGDETEYILREIKTSLTLPADFFSYAPPPDYRVTDHR